MAAFAARYARAFADVVMSQRLDPNQVVGHLNTYIQLIQENPELKNVWENPGIPTDQKVRLLDAIAQREGTPKILRNFLAVLISHQRIAAVAEIAQEFIREMDARMGFAEAEIISARPLSVEEKRELEQQASRLTGKQVRAKYSQDQSLIGGAVVKIGSTIYDGSVKGQLERMREQLAQ
jgi:F-type H+-transporting ATPase subunit delta